MWVFSASSTAYRMGTRRAMEFYGVEGHRTRQRESIADSYRTTVQLAAYPNIYTVSINSTWNGHLKRHEILWR